MASVIDTLIDPPTVSHLLGVEVETLGVWRRRGYGPRWYQIGKKIKYSLPEVKTWITAQGSSKTICDQSARQITAEQLTAILARRVLGWGVAPDRFLKGGRRWSPRWHFQPLERMEHALQLLEKANARYTVENASDGRATARVTVGDRIGTSSADSAAAALTIGLAKAIGIDFESVA